MSFPNCNNLLTTLTANCLGENRPGGVDGVVYIGNRSDLASITVDATSKEITALSLKATKKLVKLAGKNQMHELKTAIKAMKPRNMFTQTASLFFWPYTQLDLIAIQNLYLAKRLFIIVIGTDARIKIFGIDRNPWNAADLDDERGLQATGGDILEGKTIETDTWTNVQLGGDFYEVPFYFNTSVALATNITTLDGLCA